jgi:hypothetical protein
MSKGSTVEGFAKEWNKTNKFQLKVVDLTKTPEKKFSIRRAFLDFIGHKQN